MKCIYFVCVVFSVVLDQVNSDREINSARRSHVRNREYYASVPVVVVYDDSSNRNKKAISSTEGKSTKTTSATEFPKELTSAEVEKKEKIETTTEKKSQLDVPIIPKNTNQAQRSNRNKYEIPVVVVYDSATEPHSRRKLEALNDNNPVTVKNIRQRGRRRYKDQQDNLEQQPYREVKRTTQVLEEATLNPIESNSLPKETVKTKTVVQRRRPSKEDLKVIQTTQNPSFHPLTTTEKVLEVSENSRIYSTEPVIEITTLSIDKSLQDEQIFVLSPTNNPIIQEEKVIARRLSPFKESLNLIKTNQAFVPKQSPFTGKSLNSNENVKLHSKEPDMEMTTSSIDESLRDEPVLVSVTKNNPTIMEVNPDIVQKRTRTRRPVVPTSDAQDFSNIQNPIEPVQFTRSSIDKSLQDETIYDSLPLMPKQEPIILAEKTDKIQRRTRTRGPVVPIVNSQNFVYQNGEFHYSFEGGDGTKKFENGVLKPFKDEVTGEAVEGGYSYKDKDGKSFSLTYTADENGYRPVGDHLPTPPPIPPAIARALRYLATKPTPADYDDVTEKIQPQDTQKAQDTDDLN